MENEVVIDVRAENNTRAVFGEVDRDSRAAGDKAGQSFGTNFTKRINTQVTEITKSFDRITDQVTEHITNVVHESGGAIDSAGRDIGDRLGTSISSRISERVRVAFDRLSGGKQSVNVDVNERRPRVNVDVNVDESSRKTFLQRISDLASKAGDNLSSGVRSGLSTAFSGDAITLLLKTLGATLLAIVGAPAVGAAFVAALLAGLGGGVLAAGIVGAFQDPRILGAAKDLGAQIKGLVATFGQAFSPFVADTLEKFSRFLGSHEVTDNLNALATTFAPILGQLGTGFISLLQNALPGIVDAATAAAPLFQVLADHMPAIGQAVGDFFRNVADGAPGAVQLFSDVLSVVETLLPIIGSVASAWADMYNGISRAGHRIMDIVRQISRAIHDAGSVSAAAFGLLGAVATGVAGSILRAFQRVQSFLSALHGKTIVVTIRQVIQTVGSLISGVGHAIGNLFGFAHGGIVGAATGGMQSGLRLVGEHGPELADLPAGTRVHSNPDTERILAGSAGGGQPIIVQLMVGAEVLAEAVVDPLRGLVRQQGRGSVQTFLGQPGRA